MAIMVIVTGCTNFGADMKAEKMKICKETFLTDNKVPDIGRDLYHRSGNVPLWKHLCRVSENTLLKR